MQIAGSAKTSRPSLAIQAPILYSLRQIFRPYVCTGKGYFQNVVIGTTALYYAVLYYSHICCIKVYPTESKFFNSALL